MEADFNASVGQLFECFSSGAAARARSLSQNSFDHLQSARRSLREEQAGYARRLAEMENLHQQQQQETEEAAGSRIREAKEEALRYKGLLDDANNRLGAQGRELVDVKQQLVTSQTAAQAQRRIDLATIEETNRAHGELERKVRILETENDENKDKIEELENKVSLEQIRSNSLAQVVKEKELQDRLRGEGVKKVTRLQEELNEAREAREEQNLTDLDVSNNLYQVADQVMQIDVTTPQARRELEVREKALTKEAIAEKYRLARAKKHRQNQAQRKKKEKRDRREQGQEQTGENLDENDGNGTQARRPEVICLDDENDGSVLLAGDGLEGDGSTV